MALNTKGRGLGFWGGGSSKRERRSEGGLEGSGVMVMVADMTEAETCLHCRPSLECLEMR